MADRSWGLRNPICLAPCALTDPKRAYAHTGAVFAKTVTLEPRIGKPNGWAEVSLPTGERYVTNWMGLPNVGAASWLSFEVEKIRKLAHSSTPLVMSIAMKPKETEYLGEAMRTEGHGFWFPDAIEVNPCCPNAPDVNLDVLEIFNTITTLRRYWDRPISVKLPPDARLASRIVQTVDPWVDGYSAVNAYPLYFPGSDPKIRAVSGRWLLPIALTVVQAIRLLTTKMIFGVGGVSTTVDVRRFYEAGANAVQVGSAEFLNPGTIETLVDEVKTWRRFDGET